MKVHRPHRTLLRDSSGNFAIQFALLTTVIFGAAGLAIDYARQLDLKIRINNAMDAATLATARALSIGEVSKTGTAAENYFKDIFAANMGDNSFNSSAYTLDSFVLNTSNKTVSAEVSGSKKLFFLRVGFGAATGDVSSNSQASYGIGDIEVAMVLDVTGSMGSGSGSKLDNLQDAARLAVTKLLAANSSTDEHIRISLVPYDWNVNAGPLATYVYPDYNEAKSDAPVFDSAYRANYNVKTHLESYGAECEHRGLSRSGQIKYFCRDRPSDFLVKAMGFSWDKCATERKAPKSGGTSYQYTDANPSYGMIPRDSRLALEDCLESELVPLTSNATTLNKAIDTLSGGGATAGHIGLQWAWYTVSHNWADYLPVGSKPDNFATNDRLAKYIIMMTDGLFNTAYAGTSDDDVNRQYSLAELHLDRLCTAVKAQGIKIFTVGYESPEASDTILKSCASPDEGNFTYFYEPDSAQELELAYQTIADLIRTLRLTQ